MSSFILRKIDPELWQRVRSRCRSLGLIPKDLIERLLKDWLASFEGKAKL